MTLAAVATETKATALLAECRRCLALGVDLKAQYIKDAIDQLESITVNDTSGRTNILADTTQDGRSAAEAALAA